MSMIKNEMKKAAASRFKMIFLYRKLYKDAKINGTAFIRESTVH